MILPLRLVNKISCAQFHLISAFIVKEEDEAHKKNEQALFRTTTKENLSQAKRYIYERGFITTTAS